MVLVVSGKKKIIFIWQGREELRDRERERDRLLTEDRLTEDRLTEDRIE